MLPGEIKEQTMNDLNIYVLIGLIIRIVAIGYIVLYIVPKQFFEVLRPRNWLTGLRWKILFFLLFIVLTAVPSLTYQGTRLHSVSVNSLQNLSSVTGNLSYLGLAVLLGMIYNYRKKG